MDNRKLIMNKIQNIILILFLINLTIVCSLSSEKVDNFEYLRKTYNDCKQSKNDCEKQMSFYNNFPIKPDDFFNTFEYIRDINDSSYDSKNLYNKVSDYIDLYMNLNCVYNEQFINNSIDFIINHYKIKIKLNPSEYFEAYDTFKNYFIDYIFLKDIELSTKILSNKNDSENIAFWEAIFFYWENKTSLKKFIEGLEINNNYNPKVYIIMDSVYKEHLINLEHYHD